MTDCLFCKIIVGAIPNYTVHQDEHILAFLDIHPCSPGHTVVVPKKHYAEIGAMEAQSWSDMMASLQAVIKKVDIVMRPAGLNVGINNRAAAGQAVPHVHWHIIPRYEGDGGGSMHSIVRSKEAIEVGKIAQLFV